MKYTVQVVYAHSCDSLIWDGVMQKDVDALATEEEIYKVFNKDGNKTESRWAVLFPRNKNYEVRVCAHACVSERECVSACVRVCLYVLVCASACTPACVRGCARAYLPVLDRVADIVLTCARVRAWSCACDSV